MFCRKWTVLSSIGRRLLNDYEARLSFIIPVCSKKGYSLCLDQPAIMKLDTAEFKALFSPELTTLASLFKKYGYELRLAGGAVRDLLTKIQPKDLDFATTATPDQMKEMFSAEGVRTINTKGEKHGTVTPRINEKENFEVTTLRIDVVTDGRHADVEFTTDWKLDASRRDLTINSMFLGLDGTLYDYFGGYQDIMKRRVAFVGDPNSRIQEDFLRILRYFRFYGRIAEHADCHDDRTLKAIRLNADGLGRISGERIWSELRRILEGNLAGDLVKTMLSLGLGPPIGLPVDPDVAEFDRVWSQQRAEYLHPVALLVALLRVQDEVMNFHSRVKLSSYERDLGFFVVEHRGDKPHVKPLRPYQLLVVNSKGKTRDTKEWVCEVLKYRGDSALLSEFEQWNVPRFPLNGGKALGLVVHNLKQRWVECDFNLSSEDLLLLLPDVLSELGVKANR
ncbi:CCA tRNA nucleotidyltransferase 1, mitochondrial isoform X2 [Zootermopsis nevadensis]|uniref:CCA tRNA nucleotidyltransferase 1, mitochondrial isoform X2 n=1 Tax=Zootermopsis nevadensis TaxID=136037 RepID=UPI000B8E6A4C|nr:CCA tRNA nucleotidyltransferase 1, mitochondrial isoform X2 [Zootermopsis nevadensis]